MLILLAACNNQDGEPDPVPNEGTNGTDQIEGSDVSDGEKGFFDVSKEEWQQLQFTKADFDSFLSELLEEEEGLFSDITFDADAQTIEFVLVSADGETLENQITAHFMDTMVRAFYMRSDYFDSQQQPLLRFFDAEGILILENNQLLED